ncbi:MAG: pilus assembly protein PilM [Gammaproteobacteria bacterium]|nr:pilus assembly protein PilM [Gammaproteobacteria bacterium]
MMELSKTGSSYRIEGIGVEALPANAVVEKNVAEIESVSESVKRALSKSKIKLRNVAVAVAGSSVITKKITMPASLSEDEMEGHIQLEADQYIPYPLEEVSLDFQIIGPTDSNPETVDVLLAACRSENVDNRVAAVEMAGLTAKIVDIEAYTIETVFSAMSPQMPDEGMGKTIAIIDIGATMTSLSVLHDQKLVYTREQNFGGKQLTEEIMRRYGLSYDEAGLAKRQGGLPDNYEPEVLYPFKETTVQQVSRFLQFFYSAGGSTDNIDHLVLAGGTACLPDLAELTESHIGVPTTIANPFSDMSSSSRVNKANLEADAPSFLVAAGLAIRGAEYV